MISRRIFPVALALAIATLMLPAGGPARRRDAPGVQEVQPLRIGINSLSPPFAFQLDGRFVGLEVDFARELSRTLGRPIRIVDLPFATLLPALLEGRVDVVMSGLSISLAREVRVAFGEPYLHSGLMALMRRGDLARYSGPNRSAPCEARFSVLAGGTGERFVRDKCPRSQAIFPTDSREVAISEVKLGRSDIFVGDAAVVAWVVSGQEGDLSLRREPLDREDLAWVVRRQDSDLLERLNGALAQWRVDGTRALVLDRWMPYWRTLEEYTDRLPPPARLP